MASVESLSDRIRKHDGDWGDMNLSKDDRHVLGAMVALAETNIEDAVTRGLGKLFGAVDDVESKMKLLGMLSASIAQLDERKVNRLLDLLNRSVRNEGQKDEVNILNHVIEGAWRWYVIKPYLRRASVLLAAVFGYSLANADKIAAALGLG